MFETGKRIYFRDGEFKAMFGTIIRKLDENPATVTLSVRGDDGNIYVVQKPNPDIEHMALVDDNYQQHGHY